MQCSAAPSPERRVQRQRSLIILIGPEISELSAICTMDCKLASRPEASGSNPSIYKILKLMRLINGTAQNSGQRLDNVGGTHLELACGKLVLPKNNLLLIWDASYFPQYHCSRGLISGRETLTSNLGPQARFYERSTWAKIQGRWPDQILGFIILWNI